MPICAFECTKSPSRAWGAALRKVEGLPVRQWGAHRARGSSLAKRGKVYGAFSACYVIGARLCDIDVTKSLDTACYVIGARHRQPFPPSLTFADCSALARECGWAALCGALAVGGITSWVERLRLSARALGGLRAA